MQIEPPKLLFGDICKATLFFFFTHNNAVSMGIINSSPLPTDSDCRARISEYYYVPPSHFLRVAILLIHSLKIGTEHQWSGRYCGKVGQ